MRQIGVLEDPSKANRFTAYLVTEGVAAHAEEEDGGWAIWVRDENQIDQAKEAYEDFRHNPDAPRYQDVERTADSLLREQARKREEARKNVVEMRGKWRQAGSRRAPLVLTLIGLSVVASLATNFGQRAPIQYLVFFNPAIPQTVLSDSVAARFHAIRQGEVWRLITPAFVHGGVLHLAFNMYWLYIFGTQIEQRRGTLRLGLLALAIALISNAIQAALGDGTLFFGMSGVVFGLFGYVWMKTMYAPEMGMFVNQVTVIVLMGFFFLCFTPLIPDIANLAHAGGLASGVGIGYAPVMWKSGGG